MLKPKTASIRKYEIAEIKIRVKIITFFDLPNCCFENITTGRFVRVEARLFN